MHTELIFRYEMKSYEDHIVSHRSSLDYTRRVEELNGFNSPYNERTVHGPPAPLVPRQKRELYKLIHAKDLRPDHWLISD